MVAFPSILIWSVKAKKKAYATHLTAIRYLKAKKLKVRKQRNFVNVIYDQKNVTKKQGGPGSDGNEKVQIIAMWQQVWHSLFL